MAHQTRIPDSGKPAAAIWPAVPLGSMSLKLTAIRNSAVKTNLPIKMATVAHPGRFGVSSIGIPPL
jgi:hypothetical protein